MSHEPEELPSSLVSLWRSLRLGYRTEPMLLVAGLGTTIAAALPDALLALAVARLAAALISDDISGTYGWGLGLAALAMTGWLLGLISDRVNLRLTERAAVGIEAHMVRLHATVPTLEHHERRVYTDRLSVLRDHASALSQLYQMLFSGVGVLLRMAITIGLLMTVQPLLALLCLCALPPVLVSLWRAGAEKRAEEGGAADRRRALSLYKIGTSPVAAKEVRVARVRERMLEISASSRAAGYRPLARARTASAVWLSGAYGLFAAALVISVGLVATGPDALGRSVLVLVSGSRLSQYLSESVRQLRLFREIWLDCARRLTWLEDFAAGSTEADSDAPAGLVHGITVQNVSFRYPDAEADVLRDVDLNLPAGAIVAIVGENGAGKSTLVKLLCGYYRPTAGRISVDGVDLATISQASWQSRITGAFQDFVKFEYPVREAVGVGDVARAGDASVVASALRRAGATELVAGLADGMDTQLGSSWTGGVDLSHGQWQKVALARGFMPDDPLITILDEPTSALDAPAEAEVFERYAEAARNGRATGRMTIFVSHRFSTVRMADVIVVLDGARVAETGSHAELLARGGLYAELYRIQAAGYRSEPLPPEAGA